MHSSLAARLWILGTLVAATGCDGSTAVTGTAPDLGAAKIASTPGDVYLLGDFALYMPSAPEGPRAVIVALGGPNTRAILVTGEPFTAPPQVLPALQTMGAAMRAFADEHRVAILGTSRMGLSPLPNEVASDDLILGALSQGAVASGQPALASVPILLFGLSGGGAEVSGFAARHPEKVAGLFLKAPAGVTLLATEAQRQVPTFLALAELETVVNNVALQQAYVSNRAGGALWGMAIEPGAVHFSYSPALRNATIGWMRSIVDRRVAGASGQLQPAVAPSGWLGDLATGQAFPWGRYRGDRSAASWFPTQETADDWRMLIGAAPGS